MNITWIPVPTNYRITLYIIVPVNKLVITLSNQNNLFNRINLILGKKKDVEINWCYLVG
jgi:hypothetical protein